MKITILYNLPIKKCTTPLYRESEEDTETSALLAEKILKPYCDSVELFPISEHTVDTVFNIKADCILNFVEYTGLDLRYIANVFLHLKKLNIPFTGSSFEAYFLTTDKIAMKTAFDIYHIPTAKWQSIEQKNQPIRKDFKFPLIVKLAYEHCGVGITENSIVYDYKTLEHQVNTLLKNHQQPVIAEEYIDGRELQVTIFETRGKICVLPPAEYYFPKNQPVRILTYDGRWTKNHNSFVHYYVSKASISDSMAKKINEVCINTYTKLGLSNYARFDIRIIRSHIFILEVNANPGLDDDTENGLAVAYKSANMSYKDFLFEIIHSAISTHRTQL